MRPWRLIGDVVGAIGRPGNCVMNARLVPRLLLPGLPNGLGRQLLVQRTVALLGRRPKNNVVFSGKGANSAGPGPAGLVVGLVRPQLLRHLVRVFPPPILSLSLCRR